jgi:hypothetical protein
VSFNQNKVTKLENGEKLYNFGTNEPTITEEGRPIDAFYVYDADGFFQNKKEVKNHEKQFGTVTPGDIKYKNHSGKSGKDGKINGDDRIAINSSSRIPKYNYAFGFNLGYKGFSFETFFQGVAKIRLYQRDNLDFPLKNGANAEKEWINDSWTPDHPNAMLPIIKEASYGGKNNYQASTFWLKKAGYLRVKNIKLSYSIPEVLLSKIKVDNITSFVNAENPFLISPFKHYDPETVSNYVSIYHYPNLKTYSAGININF